MVGYQRRLLREPLLHFLLLGAALFLLYARFGDMDTTPSRERILVDEADLSRLSQQFQRTWMRPPTRAELEGLAEDFVKEEILYREALALGLDQDDPVIRRRLRQKMEFLNADLTELQPTDTDLEAYLQANPEAFRRPPRFSFRQIFLNPRQSAADARQRANHLMTRLNSGPALDADLGALGDPTLLPSEMDQATTRQVSGAFGADFADALTHAEPGGWSGPYSSAYGLHLVQLTAREPGSLPTLAEVRAAVEREWDHERRQKADAHFYQALRDRYSVEIRLPEVTAPVPAVGRDDNGSTVRP